MVREALYVVVAFALVAGCVATPTTVQKASVNESPSSPLLRQLEARATSTNATGPNATLAANATAAEPWWIAIVNATPEGGLAAFQWDVPANALVPWSAVPSSPTKVLPIEITPVFTGAPDALQSWGIVGFVAQKDGTLEPGPGYVSLPYTTSLDGSAPKAWPAAHGPMLTELFGVGAATRISFVALAKTTSPMEVGIAFRVLAKDPSPKDKPAETPDAFVAVRHGPPTTPPTVAARGFGFNIFDEERYDDFPAGFSHDQTFLVGTATVDEGAAAPARMVGGPWSPTLSVAGALTHGWARSSAAYFGGGEGIDRWSMTTAARGATSTGGGTMTEAGPAIFAGQNAFSFASSYSTSDGDAKVGASLHIETASKPSLFQTASVGEGELGATLQELFGAPAAKHATTASTNLPTPGWTVQGIPDWPTLMSRDR